MSDIRETLLEKALDRIEEREAKVIVWGIVDAAFGQSELLDLVNPLIDEALEGGLDEFVTAEQVLEDLLERKLITTVPTSDGLVGYRSRMAETIRLIQRLRQLFPKHSGPIGWQSAPALVADFRFLRRPRRYPARNVTASTATAMISELSGSEALSGAFKALLDSGGPDMLLSGFQVRATQRILRAIESNLELATIVCAGTGSGKTLAFYLPALTSVARHVLLESQQSESQQSKWVKVVALYPRTELLKDQLHEVLSRIRSLRNIHPNGDSLKIKVGALYGDTPDSARYCNWRKVGNDRVCPVLACPTCSGELRWLHRDLGESVERLVCVVCEDSVDASEFLLTRESLKKNVPDILFTTTEMLNQRLADSSMAHLFGVGSRAARSPELVLMDEAHTYDGKHGAQVAYLMRRWQRVLDQRLRFVGLSATLREATQFFAALTGCRKNMVDEVSPRLDEVVSEGAEYMLALRGDPVSRTALLSTTIQASMLLQRCLDPKSDKVNTSKSRGVFGQRTFVFTDNLDVINRLYFDLLSAEGRNSYGDPDMRRFPDGGLAVLRETGISNARYLNGQDWRFCEDLQGSLKRRLSVKRVSSQDRGVDPGADVVVATSVLEVGFDDPGVGAVIQHKAPRSMAGFLQRKGRGGRTRGMRPWTVIVLSDYGRDRGVYQSYDLLFDPELTIRTLPLENRYITRMQAVFATIDYLGLKLDGHSFGSVWNDLCGGGRLKEERRKKLIREIRNVLTTETGTNRLSGYLKGALGISKEELSSILWEFPRPLMTTVLPTALRRLESDWSSDGKPQGDYQSFNNPLPDFVPSSLFSDFSLAEVSINFYGADSDAGVNTPTMSFFAAMREFAPGRVSRRFGVAYRTERHWIAPSADFPNISGGCDLDLELTGTHQLLGNYQICSGGSIVSIPVYRPTSFRVDAPPKGVSDSSNSLLTWHTQLVASVEPFWLSPPSDGVWPEFLPRVGFFMHSNQAPVEIRRFAIGSSAEIGLGSEKVKVDITYRHKGNIAGLGTSFKADGILFQIKVPVNLYRSYDQTKEDREKWRSLRTARFNDLAWRGERLGMVPNPFLREWLAQVYLSGLTYEAMRFQIGLAEADNRIQAGKASISLIDVLGLLFQSQIVDEPDDTKSLGNSDKLRQELDLCLRDPTVVAELHRLGAILWEPISPEWESWLRGVYHSTLAASLLQSLTDICPSIDQEDLAVDLDRGAVRDGQDVGFSSGVVEVWFTEKNPGGNGLVEEFMRRYAEDPRRFFSTVRANLHMGEFELIEYQLCKVLTILANDGGSFDSEVAELVRNYRISKNFEQKNRVFKLLRRALLVEGFSPFHGFLVALSNRVLRPGSGPATDTYLAKVMSEWREHEERLDIEVDLRVMTYYLSQDDDIDQVISDVGNLPGIDKRAWRSSVISGLLWPRGQIIRRSALRLRSPFGDLPPVERLLVADSIGDDRVLVSMLDVQWLEKASEQLAEGRQITLTCPDSDREKLSGALNALVTNPVESGYLRAYARLQGIRQIHSQIEADIELVEASQ